MNKYHFCILFLFFSRMVFAFSDSTVSIIEKVKKFSFDNTKNRSLLVRGLLKKYIETKDEKFLRLSLVFLNKIDPLYLLINDYFDVEKLKKQFFFEIS